MSATEERTGYVGAPVKRREDRTLLTGRGTYVDNMAPAGTLAMVVVRSPYASARVTSVAVDAATFTATVRDLRWKLARRTTRQYLGPARQLYEWIVRPLEPVLAERKPQTLVFVPGGALRTIPFSASFWRIFVR